MKFQELLNVIIPALFIVLALFLDKKMRTGKYDYLKLKNWRLILWLSIIIIIYIYLEDRKSVV